MHANKLHIYTFMRAIRVVIIFSFCQIFTGKQRSKTGIAANCFPIPGKNRDGFFLSLFDKLQMPAQVNVSTVAVSKEFSFLSFNDILIVVEHRPIYIPPLCVVVSLLDTNLAISIYRSADYLPVVNKKSESSET